MCKMTKVNLECGCQDANSKKAFAKNLNKSADTVLMVLVFPSVFN